jgi:hypothetical protein
MKDRPSSLTVSQQLAQQDKIRVLLEWGGIDIKAKYLDGNTSLHYLAGTLNMSDITLSMMREMDGGEGVWQESKNCHWGGSKRNVGGRIK